MPTQNKTANLNLNSWLGTDKPKRIDFVEDNAILDEAIGEHIKNFDMHFSTADRTLFQNPFEIGTIEGNGNATQEYTFSFLPKFVFIFLKGAPFTEYDSTNGYTLCNSAVLASGCGSTKGASLLADTLTLSQSTTADNGIFMNLNKENGQYFYIAFK